MRPLSTRQRWLISTSRLILAAVSGRAVRLQHLPQMLVSEPTRESIMSVIYRVASNLPPRAKRVILGVHRRWWTAVRRVVTTTSPGRRWLFGRYVTTNYWGDDDSRSGRGSNLEATAVIRRELPRILERHDISSVLDVPCDDGFWAAHLEHRLERYVGADIVPALIDKLQASAAPGREYLCLDAVRDVLPRVDAILSRDFLGHLSQNHVAAVLANFRRSGASFLIATTHAGYTNSDIETGNWRPLNLAAAPYNLGPPLDLVNEGSTETGDASVDKALGVWRLDGASA